MSESKQQKMLYKEIKEVIELLTKNKIFDTEKEQSLISLIQKIDNFQDVENINYAIMIIENYPNLFTFENVNLLLNHLPISDTIAKILRIMDKKKLLTIENRKLIIENLEHAESIFEKLSDLSGEHITEDTLELLIKYVKNESEIQATTSKLLNIIKPISDLKIDSDCRCIIALPEGKAGIESYSKFTVWDFTDKPQKINACERYQDIFLFSNNLLVGATDNLVDENSFVFLDKNELAPIFSIPKRFSKIYPLTDCDLLGYRRHLTYSSESIDVYDDGLYIMHLNFNKPSLKRSSINIRSEIVDFVKVSDNQFALFEKRGFIHIVEWKDNTLISKSVIRIEDMDQPIALFSLKNTQQLVSIHYNWNLLKNVICVWDVATLKCLRKIHISPEMREINLAADERTVVCAKKYDKAIMLVDLVTGARKEFTLSAPIKSIIALDTGDIVINTDESLIKLSLEHIQTLRNMAETDELKHISLPLLTKQLAISNINNLTKLPEDISSVITDFANDPLPLDTISVAKDGLFAKESPKKYPVETEAESFLKLGQ